MRREKIFLEAARRFADCIAAKKAGDLKMLWGFNGAALELFRSAKASGGVCILEQTILPARIAMRLLREELERWPDWEPGFDDIEGDAVIIEREEEEWKLADCIVAGSQFVRSGLMECGVPETKIRIVPYGVDSRMFARPERKNAGNDNGRLKVLFAGAVGLRKGAPDLLDALIRLGPEKVEARFAGPIALDRGKIEPYKAVAAFLGPVPRSQMADLYHWADVFVLPSIVEGSATVCYEALMAGLPVITTPNAGTIVRDGIDGFIIPIRKSDTLAKIIANYQQDRPLLDRHKFSAIESRERVSLDRYKTGLIEVLLDLQAS
ncbi:MAG: glycosyltransferase family 4 protein [Gammaproteobacteria bacterium]